ncbi:NAD(P)-dependent oxidoreductase [Rhodospira trueperi]|uniref:2-hydroxy-3-oxopropionate reductase n=1 Tax=Rhodospira trueperi TaxID=69960 RepID=A0A1G7BI62_9PROT|nr:NAD(P)-dependent oxidoreductase [Rhodospira trueperi]SDE26673.1 2-hydroxy-3-oxopropionate reductase [Rhodospira trueperi]
MTDGGGGRPSLNGLCVGVIGLGLMGRPMARNLKAAGATVIVHNRSPGPMAELGAEGFETAASPAAVARDADSLILMVSDTPAVEAVITGSSGVLTAARPATLIVDMGTTAVTATRTLASRVARTGAAWIDAPVSGGQIGAEQATLTIMAGGVEADIDRARPLFEVLGRRFTHVGDVGAGQVAKAANQVIVGLTIGAVAEGLALARRAGVDPARVREALMGGFAGSRILELHGQRMVEGRFTPGGRVTTQRKDLAQALDLAETLGLDLPATALTMALYDRLIAAGDGNLDHAALVRALDDWPSHTDLPTPSS